MAALTTSLEVLDILRRRYPHPVGGIQGLKSQTDGFQPLWDGSKTFDNRQIADRAFDAGQILVHHEWNNGATEPLGRFVIYSCHVRHRSSRLGDSRGMGGNGH